MRRCRCRSSARRCMDVSNPPAKSITPTGFSRRCESSLVVTSRRRDEDMNENSDKAVQSDALVLFGITGDLAYKMIIPALYAMAKRGALRVPVIGVALQKWSQDQLYERVKDSLQHAGGIDDQKAFDQLLSLLRYVSGDYSNRDTFTALKKELGDARHPAHYLAIPPLLFETVIQNLGAAGLAEGARVIVEKPFGRDLVSAH